MRSEVDLGALGSGSRCARSEVDLGALGSGSRCSRSEVDLGALGRAVLCSGFLSVSKLSDFVQLYSKFVLWSFV